MTLDPIVAIPAIASAITVYKVSAQAAFFRIYLPVLLLLPDGYYFGFPVLNFHQYAIIPIGFALCWAAYNGKWRWSFIDVAVFGFIAWMLASDFHGNPSGDFVNRIAYPITLSIFPYMAGKLLIEQSGMRIAVAKRLVFFVFIDVLISVYEFRFSANPYRNTLNRYFSSVDPWFTQVRYGFGRTAGPFGHAIFMGAIIVIAILLHRYISHFGMWEPRFRWFPHLKLAKSKILLGTLILGSLMTISRGPWIAALFGLLIASVGLAQNRKQAFRRAILIMVAGGSLFYFGAKTFVSDSAATSSREEIASAEYRANLWTEYEDIAMQRSFWGWGSSDWPKIRGMSSIDNWYLLLMLMYGITGVVLFVFMLVLPVGHLIWTGMLDTSLYGDQRALMFTMGGIILSVGVGVATVFLGGQLFPLLFLLIGWSDACLTYRPKRFSAGPVFAFQKVIA